MEAITRRETILGTGAVAATVAVSPIAVLAHRPRQPFGYLALAGHRERPRWRHPVVLPRKGEVPSDRLAACVGPAMDEPLPVHALPFGDIQPVLYPVPQPFDRACAIDVRVTVAKAKRRHQSDAPSFRCIGTRSITGLEIQDMKLLDAQVLDGALVLVLDGSAQDLFSAKTVIAEVLGCDVHLATPGMMTGLRSARRKFGESVLESLARFAIIEAIGGKSLTPEPVIVRRNGVMSGAAVFRGTRVPPGPIFSMLAEMSAQEIVRHDYPSVSKADIELALQQACRLLEREAPWVD
jgi:uncharacterized protein (DUF433 family)